MRLVRDSDLDKAIVRETEVEVLIGGEVDYRGKLIHFTPDTVITYEGRRYLRVAAEIRTV